MTTNFDEIIERRNTNCLKYDFAKERKMPEDVLPLWVADMDFCTPTPVVEALKKSVEHGIFGYSDTKNDYFQTLESWFLKRHNWKIQREWLVKCPGIVYALAMGVQAFSKKGDAILIQPPVYYPFSGVIRANKRKLVTNSLIEKNGRYEIDFVDFEKKIRKHDVKCFILCNPHNPVGRVWTKDELIRMGDICKRYKVIVIADEIHQDFIYVGHKHEVFANVKEEFAALTVTCTAPSKTFNLAGLQTSNIFIANPKLKRKFKKQIEKSGYSQLNNLGLVACQAAYTHGEVWLEELKAYLFANLDFAWEFIRMKMPEIKLIEPQGTYLIWLDFRALGLSEAAIEDMIVNEAKLWLDGGTMFGKEGKGFQRINIACPRATLEEALNRLYKAYLNLDKKKI